VDVGFAVVHVLAPGGEFAASLVAALAGRRCVVWADPAAALAGLAEAECVVAGALPAGARARVRRLQVVHALGAGVDGLLAELPPEVVVVRAAELTASEVCEHAWGLILALARQVPLAVEQQRGRVWRPYAAQGLAGRTLAVLGLGAIGGRVAALGAALGMKVIGTRRRARVGTSQVHGQVVEHGPGATRVVVAAADVVVVALPRTAATTGLLGADMLAAMRPGALLVVVSRGGIVDEEALVDRLRGGHLGGAALDVTADEPLNSDSPLWHAPNLLLTPHVGGRTPDYARRLGGVIRMNLDRLERGLSPLGLVDRLHGY
jgi:phosphoglycerate dehydrogenase-like enzyme